MRPRPLLPLVLAALAASPARARPESGPGDDGLLLALRAGWALPIGDVTPGAPLEDVADGKLPLGIEVGYRFGRHLRATLYVGFAPLALAQPCPAGASCSGYDGRFGVGVQVHLAPRSRLDPWLGAGFGVEHLRAEGPLPGGGETLTRSWLGLEVPLEAGLDVRLSPTLGLGPFAAVSIARFTSATSGRPGGPSTNEGIEDRATHGWAQAGLRMTVKL